MVECGASLLIGLFFGVVVECTSGGSIGASSCFPENKRCSTL